MEAMTRRRVLCGLLLASALLVGFAGWLVLACGPRTMQSRFEKVKKGMTREEVIRTVGGPPGDYADGRISVPNSAIVWEYECWTCDEGQMHVLFDDGGTVTKMILSDPRPPLTERIRRWLGL
jgi:hypothetical protein